MGLFTGARHVVLCGPRSAATVVKRVYVLQKLDNLLDGRSTTYSNFSTCGPIVRGVALWYKNLEAHALEPSGQHI
jgi:hypothetical protein